MPRCRQNSAYLRCGTVNRRLQSPLARDESNLPLSEPIKGVILIQNCREVGECRLIALDVMIAGGVVLAGLGLPIGVSGLEPQIGTPGTAQPPDVILPDGINLPNPFGGG